MLKERTTTERALNEFVTFEVTESVERKSTWDDGFKTIIELRAGAAYTVYRGDKDGDVMEHRKAAYRALADLLYRDVLMDLRKIMHTIGEGQRRESMRLVGELHDRLLK
jgi:hypothetical protein